MSIGNFLLFKNKKGCAAIDKFLLFNIKQQSQRWKQVGYGANINKIISISIFIILDN